MRAATITPQLPCMQPLFQSKQLFLYLCGSETKHRNVSSCVFPDRSRKQDPRPPQSVLCLNLRSQPCDCGRVFNWTVAIFSRINSTQIKKQNGTKQIILKWHQRGRRNFFFLISATHPFLSSLRLSAPPCHLSVNCLDGASTGVSSLVATSSQLCPIPVQSAAFHSLLEPSDRKASLKLQLSSSVKE